MGSLRFGDPGLWGLSQDLLLDSLAGKLQDGVIL